MAIGRVIKFNEARGFGFIAPSTGGEDVFLHVNDLTFPEHYLRVGQMVEFDAEPGDGGLKASRVRLYEPRVAVPSTMAAKPSAPVNTTTATATESTGETDEDVCDVLTVQEFTIRVTDLLLRRCGSMTGTQISTARDALTELALSHGWVDSN
jgi:cold shock CspA family protein